MRLLLLLLLIALQTPVIAQTKVPWPRNPITNRIEFDGQLSWPDSVRTELQRQALVRRWYRRKLTNETIAMLRKTVAYSGLAYAGVPQESCYTLGILNADQEHFKLCFSLLLTPNDAGLTYKIFDLQCYYYAFDVGNQQGLESVLAMPDARVQTIMEGFHQQLLSAIKGWQ